MISTTKTSDKPVAILGAGLAGLTAAVQLKRHGIPFILFEGASAVSGLCKSERDEEGFTYDCGVHFITNRLAAAVGIATHCRAMTRYGETVHLGKRQYSYPLGLMQSPRFASSALSAKVKSLFGGPTLTAQEYYRSAYGRRLADEVAIPLTEAWSGNSADKIAAAVGQKFATSLPRIFMLKSAARMTNRVIGVGYSSTIKESPNAWHVYPNHGIAEVCQKLADEVIDDIRLNSRVEQILVQDNAVSSITSDGNNIDVSGVISTAPVHALGKMVRGTDKLEALKSFRYRAMVFVNLKISGDSGLKDVVTWVPEDKYPFFRLSDVGMGLPWLVPSGKSQVTCDIGCKIGDEVWAADDNALADQCIAALEHIVPGVTQRVIGSRVVRVPLAYPIYDLEYEVSRQKFANDSGIDGLVSVGRNGEFAHILMEDVYWRTRWKVSKFIAKMTS
jgi:protoporphyrinogen oxidase